MRPWKEKRADEGVANIQVAQKSARQRLYKGMFRVYVTFSTIGHGANNGSLDKHI